MEECIAFLGEMTFWWPGDICSTLRLFLLMLLVLVDSESALATPLVRLEMKKR